MGAAIALALMIGLVFAAVPISGVANELAGRGVPAASILILSTTLLPQALSTSLPLALLTPPFRVRRGVPLLGLFAALALVAALNSGWVVPKLNQQFRVLTVRALNIAGAPPPARSVVDLPRRSNAELSVTELLEESRRP
jgi:lipopolysaccharide export LptBFGC system permease protein LptF